MKALPSAPAVSYEGTGRVWGFSSSGWELAVAGLLVDDRAAHLKNVPQNIISQFEEGK